MVCHLESFIKCLSQASYPGSQLMWGGKESLVSNIRAKCQILHTFHVSSNLQDTCPYNVAWGMPEIND